MPNGGRPWTAARPRRSEARKSRCSLIPSAATMTPRMPDGAGARQRLGVHPRAGDDDRAGRADVDVLRAQLAVRVRSRPGGGPTSGPRAPSRPEDRARDVERIVTPVPGPHLVDDARERRLDRVRPVAAGDPPPPAAPEQQLTAGRIARPRGRAAAGRLGPALAGRRRAVAVPTPATTIVRGSRIVLDDRLAAARRPRRP